MKQLSTASGKRQRADDVLASAATLVPLLRIRDVRGVNHAYSEFTSSRNDLLLNVKDVRFADGFNRSLYDDIWPQRVERTKFDSTVDKDHNPIDLLTEQCSPPRCSSSNV